MGLYNAPWAEQYGCNAILTVDLDLKGQAVAHFEANKLQKPFPQDEFHRYESKKSNLQHQGYVRQLGITLLFACNSDTPLSFKASGWPSLAECEKFLGLKHTIAARLFNLSALSTNPNLAGGSSGDTDGCVTPCTLMFGNR